MVSFFFREKKYKFPVSIIFETPFLFSYFQKKKFLVEPCVKLIVLSKDSLPLWLKDFECQVFYLVVTWWITSRNTVDIVKILKLRHASFCAPKVTHHLLNWLSLLLRFPTKRERIHKNVNRMRWVYNFKVLHGQRFLHAVSTVCNDISGFWVWFWIFERFWKIEKSATVQSTLEKMTREPNQK